MAVYLTDVIPVAATGSKDILTYYAAKKFSPGSIITIPIRKRLVPALVVNTRSVTESKSRLRQSTFSLRKIDARQKGSEFLCPSFIEAVHEAAHYFAATPGTLLTATIPKKILEHPPTLPENKPTQKKSTHTTNDVSVLQTNQSDRIATYRSLVRECFAQKESVMLIVPKQDEVAYFHKEIERGIDQYIFSLHAGMSHKQLSATIESAASSSHPVAIVATASFLFIPRNDIKTIIVERESSRFYYTQRRPKIDVRTFIEMYARHAHARLILADSFLRIETLHRHEEGEISEVRPVRFKYLTDCEKALIDMRQQNSIADEWTMLSREIKQLIDIVAEEGSHAAFLAPRRGLAPITVCKDCGTVVPCHECQAPVVLHKQKQDEPYFMCHKCGVKRSSQERCAHCTSWNLVPLGIGIEGVEKEIARHNPHATVFRLDRDATPTQRSRRSIVTSFYTTPGSILLGTEMMIGELSKPVPYSAVVSLDSILSLPEYTINEKIVHLVLALQAKTREGFILQTRAPEKTVFTALIEGNLSTLYKEEIADRKMVGYPPFTTLVKLSVTGTEKGAHDEMERLAEVFKDVGLTAYPAFTKKIRNKYTVHGLIKLPSDTWPQKNIIDRLQALPPHVSVMINPESLL